MQWHRSGLITSWEFTEDHLERSINGSDNHLDGKPGIQKKCEKKWGAMVIIKSLQFLPTVLSAALKEMTPDLDETIPSGTDERASHSNMMHIALAGINNQMSSLQDRLF